MLIQEEHASVFEVQFKNPTILKGTTFLIHNLKKNYFFLQLNLTVKDSSIDNNVQHLQLFPIQRASYMLRKTRSLLNNLCLGVA